MNSAHAHSIHADLISLSLLAFPTRKLLLNVLIPCLLQPFTSIKTRHEVYKVISALKICSLTLLPGLIKSLDFSDGQLIEKTLEEIHTQLEFSRITPQIIESLILNNKPACPILLEKSVELLDNPSEEIRGLALKVIIDFIDCLDKQ